VKDTFSGQQLA